MATSSHKVSIVVGVKNLASHSLNTIQKSFGQMGTFLGAFNRNLDVTINKMDRLANSMYKFNMYTSSLQRNLTNIGIAGAAVGGAVAYQGTNQALQYDYKTRTIQARMETSNEVRKQISDYILKDLNGKVAYKPTELADMGIILGQAGISNAPDMKAMLKTVSYFSEAVDAVPEQAAEMVISAAKGFGISMKNSGQITDKLSVALNKSLLHVEEMPHAIGELAGRANMYGQSLDSSLVALMTMRDQGMGAAQGSQDLLHALRQGSRIGNDDMLFKKTAGWFKQMGIDDGIFNKDTRKLKEYPELIADIEKAMINKGFSNPKYNIKNKADYDKFLASNGGKAPQDFWDSMKAMPLITKIFGAAGQAPILMGMQTKYEEVNKETGEKTGQVYYGSEALKRMYKDVKNSEGAVDKTHEIIAQSGLFQLQQLGGAWEAVQTDFFDQMIPVIKSGAEELSDWLSGNKQGSGLQKFDKAIKEAAENFRNKGNTGTAEVIETVGGGLINGARISTTMPPLLNQIGSALNDNLVKADWGSNLIEFPWHIVKNGIGFVSDIVKANEEFNAAVSELPQNLQDPAKLVETLLKGGIVLLVTGAVIKTIELGVRGVSAALKGVKIATSLSETIAKWLGGGTEGGALSKALGNNKNITANIVNVFGKTINSGGNIPGGGKSTKTSTASKTASTVSKGGKIAAFVKNGAPIAIAADIASGVLGGPSLTKSVMESKYNPLNPHTDEKVDGIHKVMQNPNMLGGKDAKIVPVTEGDIVEKFKAAIVDFFTIKKVETKSSAATNPYVISDNLNKKYGINTNNPKPQIDSQNFIDNYNQIVNKAKTDYNLTGTIVDGFNTANDSIQNLKLQNNLNVNVAPPQVNITGNIKDYVKVESKGSSSFSARETKNETAWERTQNIMQRRLGWR